MKFPDWFKLTPGFRWFDREGCICILLGWEPERESKSGATSSVTVDDATHFLFELKYQPSMTFVTWYKNSWVPQNLDAEDFTFEGAEPIPDGHPILMRLMNKDTLKHMDKDSA